ncbi:hypothetical protein BBJ28_00001855 [Nothophytophthora sp. Chile5]|nr:hypothetical protein BBJ28_00001855 [Nothophytophthora sp. Chile5]
MPSSHAFSSYRCKHARKASDLPHAFEPNELGRRQALLHLRRLHEGAYNAFLCSMPAVDSSAGHGSDAANSHTLGLGLGWSHDSVPDLASDASSGQQSREVSGASRPVAGASAAAVETTSPAATQRRTEAQRSRLRRMRATPKARKAEAERSKRRREQLTPAQRQADAERRARKRQRAEERARSRARRAEVSPESREREVQRSRDRRKNATELQRRREAQRSRERRQHASEEQVLRERERCRRRYEAKKRQNPPPVEINTAPNEATWQPPAPAAALPSPSARTSVVSTAPSRGGVQPVDLERRSQQLLHQQAGLGLQLQSLYASLAVPPRPPRG